MSTTSIDDDFENDFDDAIDDALDAPVPAGAGVADDTDTDTDADADAGARDDAFFDPTVIEDGPDDTAVTLFDGDDGTLTLAQRQTFVRLLKNYTLTAAQDPQDWAVLTEHAALIKSRLNDLFLDLHLDRERGVAYKVQVRSDAPALFPPLLKDGAYTKEETVLLVYLRQKQLAERDAGQRYAVVERDECLEQIALYRPQHAPNAAGDRDRAERAVESALRIGALAKTSDPERFTVSAVIETLLPLERLRALVAWFREQNSPSAQYAAARLAIADAEGFDDDDSFEAPVDGDDDPRDDEADDEHDEHDEEQA